MFHNLLNYHRIVRIWIFWGSKDLALRLVNPPEEGDIWTKSQQIHRNPGEGFTMPSTIRKKFAVYKTVGHRQVGDPLPYTPKIPKVCSLIEDGL